MKKHFKIFGKTILLFIALSLAFISNLSAQSMHDTWMRGQTSWRMDMGVSFGPTSGLQFQYFTPRRSTCSTLNKRIAFDFGVYYEGLLFEDNLKAKLNNWEKGGYRANLSFLFFPDLRIKANRFFIGGGFESGSRKLSGDQLLQTDFIAKAGWELSLMPIFGAPIVFRLSIKYDKCLNNQYSYFLPTFGLIYGK